MPVKPVGERASFFWIASGGLRLAAKVFRLATFALAVCIAVVALVSRFSYAHSVESMESARVSMRFPGSPPTVARQLHLNGIDLYFQTETIDASLSDVLNHYKRVCGYPRISRRGEAGHVACIGAASVGSFSNLARRFAAFAETNDLRELGGLRYAFARRIATDAGPKTFLLTMWTDTVLHPSLFLPRDGEDAVGEDPPGLPRFQASRRILAASEAGEPSGVFLYRIEDQSPADVAAFYRRALPAAGWTLIERSRSESVVIDGAHLVTAERDGVLIMVVSNRSEGGVTLTVLTSEQPS